MTEAVSGALGQRRLPTGTPAPRASLTWRRHSSGPEATKKARGGPDPRTDWLPVSTGRGGRRLRRTRERKAAGGHFRSLWLSTACPRLALRSLLGFAVRDVGPEAEGERGGRSARAAGAVWRVRAAPPAHPCAPCRGGISECPGDVGEASSLSPCFPAERAIILAPL